MELPSIEEILKNVSESTQIYVDTEAQVRESVKELETLGLPKIITGPPKPPVVADKSVLLKEFVPKKKKKHKTKKTKTLTSYQILPSDPKVNNELVTCNRPLVVDRSALERVLSARTNSVAFKPYEAIQASDITSSSDEEVSTYRVIEKSNSTISAWREDSLKALLKNSKKAKHNNTNRKEVVNQKKKSDISSYLEKIQVSEAQIEDSDKERRAPVSVFDSPHLETFYPVEKLKNAKENDLPGLKAFSRYYNYAGSRAEWYWRSCLVLDYDDNSGKFLIQWDGSNSRKYVTRLNILFEGESKEDFFQRIETATISRDNSEEAQKYYERITNMKMPPFRPLAKSTKIRIVSKIGRPVSIKELPIVTDCLEEIERDYDFSMKKAYYEYKHGIKEEKSSLKSERFALDAVVLSGAAKSDITDSLTKSVSVASRMMAEYMLNANPNIQKAIVEILAAIETILPTNQRFFMFPFKDFIDIDFFLEKAKLHSECVQAILANEWPNRILKVIDTYLGDYLNIKFLRESDKSQGRAKEFFKLVDTIMGAQLQNLVVESYKNFLRFFNLDLEVCSKDGGKSAAEKSKYRVFKLDSLIIPHRFVIYVALKIPKGTGFEILKDLKNVPVIKIRPENELVKVPSNFEEFKRIIKVILMLPIRLTKRSIPTVRAIALPDHRYENNWISSLDLSDPLINIVPAEIESNIEYIWLAIEQKVAYLKRFMFLAQEDLFNTLEDDNELEAFEEVASRIIAAKSELSILPALIDLKPLYLDCSSLIQALNKIAAASIEKISIALSDKIVESCDFLDSAYFDLDSKISIDPGQDVQKWKDLSDKQEQSEQEFEDYDSQFANVNEIWELMYKLKLRIPNVVSERYWNTYKWPNIIREHITYCKSRLDDSYYQIMNQIKIDSEFISSSYEAYKLDVESMNISDIDKTDDMHSRVEFLKSRLQKIQILAESVQKKCILLSVELTFNPSLLNELFDSFHKYEKLWTTSWDIRLNLLNWTQSLFIDLNADLVISKAVEWTKQINDLISLFRGSDSLKVVHSLKVQLDDFSRNTTIIKALRNSALRAHHWDQISKIIGFSLHDFSGLRLRQVMDLDLEMIQDILLDISDQATREYKIEIAFDAIRMEISNEEFLTEPLGSCLFISNSQNVTDIFENSIIRSRQLLDSPDSEFLASKISQWIHKLRKAQNMLSNLMDLQAFYSAILPAFDSFSSMVSEAEIKSFKWVTKFLENWAEILSKNRKFMVLILRNDLHDGIISSIARLESTKHIISQLANSRRSKFPRFYFLSDLEVLKVTCCKGDMTTCNKYIHKCFPKIKSLTTRQVVVEDPKAKLQKSYLASRTFDQQTKKRWSALKVGLAMMRPKKLSMVESSIRGRNSTVAALETTHEREESTEVDEPSDCIMEITHVEGHLQEKLNLTSPVLVSGEVESWLELLDQSIRTSILNAISSLLSRQLSDMASWLAEYPLQICSLAFAIIMSRELSVISKEMSPNSFGQIKSVLSRISQNLINSLDEYKPNYQRYANEYLISEINNYSSYLDRQKSGIDYNDVPFWSYTLEGNDIKISSMTWSYLYGFEYLGMDTRLVLIPDWISLFSNIMQNFYFSTSSIVLGPAGCFKMGLLTELASLFGYKYIVLDINTSLASKTTYDILESAILTQSWTFLKNYSISNMETISIVDHFLNLSKKAYASQNEANMDSEGVIPNGHSINPATQKIQPIVATLTIVSKEQFNKLEDQVRHSFRPITTAIPPLEVIANIRLCSSGFKDNHILAEKFKVFLNSMAAIVGWLNYKIGMRLITKIMDIATFKRLEYKGKADSELQSLAYAISKCISPILSDSELLMFEDMLKAVFPEVTLNQSSNSESHWLKPSIEQMKLSFVNPFVDKIEELYELLRGNQLVIIIGNHFSGKTSGLKILQNAISEMRKSGLPPLKLHEYHINSVSFSELTGKNKDGTCTNGVFMNIFTQASIEAQKTEKIVEKLSKKKLDHIYSQVGYSWILFAGAVKSEICDYLTNLMFNADSRFSNDCILSSSTKLIIESNDLNTASPSFVTRFSILNMGSYIEPAHIFHNSVSISLPSFVEGHNPLINMIFSHLITPTINFLNDKCEKIIHDLNALIRNMALLFTSLINEYGSTSYDRLILVEQETYIISQALLSIIWTFGMVIRRNNSSFDIFVKSNLLNEGVNEIQRKKGGSHMGCLKLLPDEGSIFDYFFEPRLWSWQLWEVLLPKNSMLAGESIFPDVALVLTPEIVRYSYFSRVLMGKNYRFVVSGSPGVGKSSLIQACLRRDNFPNFINKIKCNLDPSYNSEKIRQFVWKFYKDNEIQLDQSCLKNQRLILFIDDLEAIAADENNTDEFFSLLKMLAETGKWPTETAHILKNVSGLAVCAVMNMQSIQHHQNFYQVSNYFHYFEIDDSYDRLEYLAKFILDPLFRSSSFVNTVNWTSIVKMTYDLVFKLKIALPSDLHRSHYSFSMKDMLQLFRGLGLQLKNDFTIQLLLEMWGYQAELIFMDQLSSKEDIVKFKAYTVEQLTKYFPYADMNIFSANKIFPPGVEREGEVPVFDEQGLLVIPVPVMALDDSSLNNFRMEISKRKSKYGAFQNEKLHKSTIIDAIKLSSKILYNDLNIVMVGNHLKNQLEVATLSSYFGNLNIHQFNQQMNPNAIDLKATWHNMFKNIFHDILKRGQFMILLIDYKDINLSWQWDDIRCLLHKSIPSNCCDENLSDHSKVAVLLKLLKIIITVESTTQFEECLISHPFLKHSASFLFINPIESVTSTSIINGILGDSFYSSFPELITDGVPVTDVFFSIYQDFIDFPSSTYSKIEQILPASYDQFSDFIKSFKAIYSSKKPILNEQFQKFQRALSRIEEVLELINDLELQFYSCRKNAQKMHESLDECLKKIETERELIDKVKKDMRKDDVNITKAMDEINYCTEKLTTAMDAELLKFKNSARSILSSTRMDILELRSSLLNSPEYMPICKMLTSLLNTENKNGETVLECIRRLFSDSRITNVLISFDPALLSDSSIDRIRHIVQYSDKSSKSIAPLLGWFDAMLEYHKEMDAHKPLKAMLGVLQSLKESTLNSLQQKEAQLQTMETAFISLKIDFDLQTKKTEEASALLREAENTFKASRELCQCIINYKDRLKEFMSRLERERTLFFYNSIFSAAFSSLLAPFPQVERNAYLIRWVPILRSFNIATLSPAQYSFSQFISGTLPIDISTGCNLSCDLFLLDSITISREVTKYPAFYDPYGIACNWIMGIDHYSRIEIVGANDHDLSAKFLQAAVKGTRIIFKTLGERISKFAEDFIINSQQKSYKVEYDGSLKSIDPNFKLYIIISEPFKSLKKSYYWLRNCSLVNFSVDQNTANTLISEHILTNVFKEEKEYIRKVETDAANLRSRNESVNNRCAEFILMIKKEDLSRGELYRNIIETDEIAISIKEKILVSDEHEAKKLDKVNMIYSVSRPMSEIFLAFEKLTELNPKNYIGFTWFLDLCALACRHMESFETSSIRSCISQIIVAALNYVKHGLNRSELVILSLESALISCKYVSENPPKSVDTYISFLGGKDNSLLPISDVSNEVSGEYPRPDWISDNLVHNWERLSRWPRFKALVDNVSKRFTKKGESAWELLYNSENPLKLTHPEEFVNLQAIDQLIIIYVLRPDCIHLAVENLVNSVIPSYSMDLAPNPISHCFRYSNASTFIWVINEGLDDAVMMIKQFATEMSMISSTSFLRLQDTAINDLSDSLLDSIRRGRWYVLSDCEKNSAVLNYLSHYVIYLISTLSEKNPNFRFWVLSKPMDIVPMSIAQNSIKILIPANRSLRLYLHESLSQTIESNISGSSKLQSNYRRIIFSFLVAVSFLKSSRCFPITRTNNQIELSDKEITRAIKIFRKLCSSPEFEELDQKDILERFQILTMQYIFASQTLDTWEMRMMKSLFVRFLTVPFLDSKHHNLPSFRNMTDRYIRSETKKWMDIVKSFPNDDKIPPLVYGLDENAVMARNSEISRNILSAFHTYHRTYLEGPFKPKKSYFYGIIDLCEGFINQIKVQCIGCFEWRLIINWSRRSLDVTSKRLQLYTSQKSSKFLEHVLRFNIESYRAMINLVLDSFSNVIDIISGVSPRFKHSEKTLSEIINNQIPSEWLLSGKCYLTNLKLDEFIQDLCARLKFINNWYYVRQNPNLVNKGSLIIYDLSKMFCPKAFLDGVLLDYSSASKEPIETLEFEVSLLGAKPSSLPEKGVYISGIHLLGASWDFSRGTLRSGKIRDFSLAIPCLWIQPCQRLESRLKNPKTAPKVGGRNGTKYECPLYIYKSSKGGPLSQYMDLFITSFPISSMEPESVWIDKNVYMVCELTNS